MASSWKPSAWGRTTWWRARLTGPDGTAHDLRLIVDTGATSVVLPASWIDRLGFLPEELSPGMAHTAGGQVATQIGRLQAVAIGPGA